MVLDPPPPGWPVLGRAEQPEVLPLSVYQRVLWDWEQRHPGTASMHLFGGISLDGPIDAAALGRAVDHQLARHDALRTRFERTAEGPVQRFVPPAQGMLEYREFPDGMRAQRRADARAYAVGEGARPFALVGGSLARALLLETAPDEHVFVFVAHRLIIDPAQFWELFRDVFGMYAAAVRGVAWELPEPALQYGDLVAWQAQLVAAPAFAGRVAARRAQLAGAVPVALPRDRPIPAERAPDTHVAYVAIPPELAAFARAQSSTTFGVLLAGYQAFLAEAAGQADISLVAPFNGINKVSRKVRSLVGRVSDFLVVRETIDRDAPFRAVLAAGRATMRACYDSSEIPASAILDDDGVYDHPLARVMLNVVSAEPVELDIDGVRASYGAVPRPPWLRTNDLQWWVVDHAGLSLLAGAADVFDAHTVRRFAHDLSAVLAAAVADPDTAIRDLIAVGSARPVAFVEPTTPLERAVARIWCDELGVERVSLTDNFLELGGQSLGAMRIVARIADQLGVDLSLRVLFEYATLAALVERIGRDVTGTAAAESAPVIAELVASRSDAEVTALLAEWSPVELAVQPSPLSAQFSGDRRALFDKLVAQQEIDRSASLPIAARAPTPIPVRTPATLSQQIAWAFHQRGNCPEIGNMATALAITGPIDPVAMVRAIADLVERQAALRTVFSDDHGVLTHIQLPEGPRLELVDLSDCPAEDRRAQGRVRFDQIGQPHDLSRESFRAQLLRFADDDHLLFVAPHHIVCDGFSMRVLITEIAALYRARAAGREPDLAPLAFEYDDFCFWQHSLEQRPVGRAQLAYWAQTVAGYEGLELPGDRQRTPRGAVGLALDTYAALTTPFELDAAAWGRVERACVRLHCTPYTVIATAYFLLLTGWSGRSDACIVTGSFLRNRRGSESVIGDFNTVYPLRVMLDERLDLTTAVRKVHEAVLVHRDNTQVAPSSARDTWPEWSRYNFNYLVDAAAPAGTDLGTATMERLGWAIQGPRPNDLSLIVRPGAHGARGVLSFNAERFSPALAARIAARIVQLVEMIASGTTERIAALVRTP